MNYSLLSRNKLGIPGTGFGEALKPGSEQAHCLIRTTGRKKMGCGVLPSDADHDRTLVEVQGTLRQNFHPEHKTYRV